MGERGSMRYNRRMAERTVVRVVFDDAREASAFLQRCRRQHLDATVEDQRPIGTVKKNGPALAAWLMAHRGWQSIADAANRDSAWKAAWKIRQGKRRGFESMQFDARPVNRNGSWAVEVRYKGRGVKPAADGMDPLF